MILIIKMNFRVWFFCNKEDNSKLIFCLLFYKKILFFVKQKLRNRQEIGVFLCTCGTLL